MVADGGHTIRGNKAYHNASHGIEAGEGEIRRPGRAPAAGQEHRRRRQPGRGQRRQSGDAGQPGRSRLRPTSSSASASSARPGVVPPVEGVADTEPPQTIITSAPDNPTGRLVGDVRVHRDRQPDAGDRDDVRVPRSTRSPILRSSPRIRATSSRRTRTSRPTRSSRSRASAGPSASARTRTTASSPGNHHFEVRATDAASPDPLMDLTPAAYDWTIDLSVSDEGTGADSSPPDTFLALAPGDVTTSDLATFRFTGSDNATPGLRLEFECRLYNGPQDSGNTTPWEDCTNENPQLVEAAPPFPLTRTFEVRAIDLRRGSRTSIRRRPRRRGRSSRRRSTRSRPTRRSCPGRTRPPWTRQRRSPSAPTRRT